MHKTLLAALIKAGLIDADATLGEATAVLKAYLKVGSHDCPDKFDDEKAVKPIVAILESGNNNPPADPQPPTDPQSTGFSAGNIVGLIKISSLSTEQKLDLQSELVAQAGTLSTQQVLDRISQEASTSNPPAGATAADRVEVTEAERDKFTAAARDAILTRTWGESNRPEQIFNFQTREMQDWKPGANVRNYGLMSLPKLAQQCLMQVGIPMPQVFNLSSHDVARLVMGANPHSIGLGGIFAASDGPGYNVTGMFSNILLDAANVMLRRSYDDARTTFQIWMRQGPSVEDFKTVNKVIAGELGDPKAIPEDGEFEETTLSDGKETYKLTVWGDVFSHSWQLVVNDKLNSFTEIPIKMGRSMRRKQNRLAYDVLKDNSALADGNNLFDNTNHSNDTTSGGAPSVANLNTMTQNMMEQTGLDADSGRLNIMPRFLVHAPSNRGTVLELLGSVANPAASQSGVINIWQSGLEPVPEGELSTAAGGTDAHYFTAADSSEVDTIEYAYLQGLETPVIEQETAFDRLALRQRIYQAFAVAAIDHRGIQRHTGAA